MTPLAGEDLVPSPPGTTDPLVSPVAVCLSVYSVPGVLRLLGNDIPGSPPLFQYFSFLLIHFLKNL